MFSNGQGKIKLYADRYGRKKERGADVERWRKKKKKQDIERRWYRQREREKVRDSRMKIAGPVLNKAK